MPRSRTFALLLAIAMLALPASSLAQSAGDDQYQDPLAGQPSGGGGGGNTGSTGSSGGSGGGSAPATPSTTAGGAEGSSPQASAAQNGSGQLPRTGFDVIITIELGLALLLTGLVAQRVIVLRDRREDA